MSGARWLCRGFLTRRQISDVFLWVRLAHQNLSLLPRKGWIWNDLNRINTECVTDLDKEARLLFLSQFWPLVNWASFLEAARTVVQIGLSLKLNQRQQILLSQIRETLCSSLFFSSYLHAYKATNLKFIQPFDTGQEANPTIWKLIVAIWHECASKTPGPAQWVQGLETHLVTRLIWDTSKNL